MEHFETQTKCSFNGTRGLIIPVHGVGHHPGVVKNRLTLSIDDLNGIFEPVISEVVKLIRGQIRQTSKDVKLILLVGGFGSSFYLRKRVQEEFSDIEVKVAPNWYISSLPLFPYKTCRVTNSLPKSDCSREGSFVERLAEVKGATNRLPHVRIDARKARKYYGTECFTKYVEGEHNAKKK